MMDSEEKLPTVYYVIAWMLLAPIVLPCLLIMGLSIVMVSLIITIPILIISLIKTGINLLFEYLDYKKQVRKIIKDFENCRREK